MTRDILIKLSGTYGASLYASEYPEHAGRMVLDGVFPHGLVSGAFPNPGCNRADGPCSRAKT